MADATVYTSEGQSQGSLNLPDDLFEAEVHGHALYESIKSYLANQRQGTHRTKTRSEASGQKSKLFRQKGTGRARAGSATTGNRVGGATIFGPKPRDYSYSIPKKVRRLALRGALSDRAAGANVHVIEGLQLEAPSTRTIAKLLRSMGLGERKVLFVSSASDQNLVKSCRNIRNVEVQAANQLHAYQVLRADDLVIEKGALTALEEVFGG
ncbi:MAG: 50S ribosomal protein L4 [Candidatus Latescibacterota bacterium]|nr:MAG: 50S ribosomal protein L4 [Candidatus Latescibacterota bacterium]